jgi:hypothetical protein
MFDNSFVNNSYQTKSAYEIEISMRNRTNQMAVRATEENAQELMNLRWISDPFKIMRVHIFSQS